MCCACGENGDGRALRARNGLATRRARTSDAAIARLEGGFDGSDRVAAPVDPRAIATPSAADVIGIAVACVGGVVSVAAPHHELGDTSNDRFELLEWCLGSDDAIYGLMREAIQSC